MFLFSVFFIVQMSLKKQHDFFNTIGWDLSSSFDRRTVRRSRHWASIHERIMRLESPECWCPSDSLKFDEHGRWWRKTFPNISKIRWPMLLVLQCWGACPQISLTCWTSRWFVSFPRCCFVWFAKLQQVLTLSSVTISSVSTCKNIKWANC